MLCAVAVYFFPFGRFGGSGGGKAVGRFGAEGGSKALYGKGAFGTLTVTGGLGVLVFLDDAIWSSSLFVD